MKSFAWYDLQVIICSAIMMGYYFIVLRNKKFHQYNRFYILAVFFLSFIIPLIKIQLDKMETQQAVVQFIYVLADYNAVMDKAIASKGFQVNWDMMATVGYALVSAFFLFSFVFALIRIRKLLQQYSINHLGDVYLILTNVKGTPFSFFKYIFWNEEIDLQSATGQKILQHELTHVKEKHSIDNVIVQVMMIVGWFNPFFWLARKELYMIHEFIADKRSVDNGDAASLAEMLLAAIYPQQQFLLTNSFFFSPIKRRLLMITNNKNPRFSYMRRVVVLPLMAVVVLLFAFRMKQEKEEANKNLLNSLYGNTDTTQNPNGAGVSQAELDEYEAIVKNVFPKKDGSKLPLVEDSKTYELKRAYVISLGMSAEQKEKATKVIFHKVLPAQRKEPSSELYTKWKNENEYRVWIDGKSVANSILDNYKASDFANYYVSPLHLDTKLAKKLVTVALFTENHFNKNNDTSLVVILYRRGNNGKHDEPVVSVRVKDYSGTGTPKVVVTNKDSILKYDIGSDWSNYNAKSSTLKVIPLTNSTFLNGNPPLILVDGKKITHDEMNKISPNTIESVNVLKDPAATEKYGEEGKNGVILIKLKQVKPLFVIDDKKMPDIELSKINPMDIASMNVLKDEVATAKYGDEGKNGVVELKMKPLYVLDGKIMPKDFGIAKLEAASIESINVLKNEVGANKYGDAGKYGVIEIATKRNKKDTCCILVTPTFAKKDSTEHYDKVFTIVQVPAEFPGGKEGWLKFLRIKLNRDLPVENGAPPGKYTVNLSLIVTDKGIVKFVRAENDPGYGTAKEAVRVMQYCPNWIPAKQNGENVTSEVKQTITFVISKE